MLRKYGILLMALSLACMFIACGQKDQAENEEAMEPVEEAEPAIVPGEMVLIPEGEFTLGTEDKDSFAYFPAGKTSLPAFWIDKYEITNLEFMDFTIESGYMGEDIGGKNWRLFFTTADKANYPAILTWNDVKAYCESKGKRLPTEQEWEKAARGPDGFLYPWGNEWESGRSNTYEAGLKVPTSIGQFDDVSPYGVHDMLGNVQEWTSSEYKPYKGNPKKDPNAVPGMRVVRGLSSRYMGRRAKLFERAAYPPSAIYDFGGRCAKDATPEDVAEATSN
jgi:formylglycine-generating enzyme required for sulfatase activity